MKTKVQIFNDVKNIQGIITAIKGGVAEVVFRENIPSIHSLLESKKPIDSVQGKQKAIFEVVEKKDFRTVRAIILSSAEGVERGEELFVASEEVVVSINKDILGRMFDLFGNPIDNKPFKNGEIGRASCRERV